MTAIHRDTIHRLDGDCDDSCPGIGCGCFCHDSADWVEQRNKRLGVGEPMENARDCKHGRLKRKCDECDSEQEIIKLRTTVKSLVKELQSARDYYIWDHSLGGKESSNQELVRWATVITDAKNY